jgi:hypothetical protein
VGRTTVCFIVLGAIGCSSSPVAPSAEVPLGREFSLKPGESAAIESTDLRVTFLNVLSDSRCPADAVCVWAGDAVVALSVGRTGVELRSTSSPEASFGAYRLRLERVEPFVYSGKAIEPADYRAVLKVTRP